MTITPVSYTAHPIRAILTAAALIAWCVLTAPGAIAAVQHVQAGASAVGPAGLIAIVEVL